MTVRREDVDTDEERSALRSAFMHGANWANRHRREVGMAATCEAISEVAHIIFSQPVTVEDVDDGAGI
jgi:hypothetical protein